MYCTNLDRIEYLYSTLQREEHIGGAHIQFHLPAADLKKSLHLVDRCLVVQCNAFDNVDL